MPHVDPSITWGNIISWVLLAACAISAVAVYRYVQSDHEKRIKLLEEERTKQSEKATKEIEDRVKAQEQRDQERREEMAHVLKLCSEETSRQIVGVAERMSAQIERFGERYSQQLGVLLERIGSIGEDVKDHIRNDLVEFKRIDERHHVMRESIREEIKISLKETKEEIVERIDLVRMGQVMVEEWHRIHPPSGPR